MLWHRSSSKVLLEGPQGLSKETRSNLRCEKKVRATVRSQRKHNIEWTIKRKNGDLRIKSFAIRASQEELIYLEHAAMRCSKEDSKASKTCYKTVGPVQRRIKPIVGKSGYGEVLQPFQLEGIEYSSSLRGQDTELTQRAAQDCFHIMCSVLFACCRGQR